MFTMCTFLYLTPVLLLINKLWSKTSGTLTCVVLTSLNGFWDFLLCGSKHLDILYSPVLVFFHTLGLALVNSEHASCEISCKIPATSQSTISNVSYFFFVVSSRETRSVKGHVLAAVLASLWKPNQWQQTCGHITQCLLLCQIMKQYFHLQSALAFDSATL